MMKALSSLTNATHTTLFLLLMVVTSKICYGDVPSTNIAVASNFNLAMKTLISEFEKDHNFRINASYASSGKLFAQIRYGAPFSIFLSADTEKPELLAEKKLGDKVSIFTYANGRLCLWSNNSKLTTTTVKDQLMSLSFDHLAIANPKLAPYGLAAQSTLSSLSLFSQTKAKLVLGENISQAFQFILSKNADLGFVAYSQIKSMIDSGQIAPDQFWLLPAQMHTPIKQNAILLNKAKNDPVASAFYKYIKSDKAKQIILKHGYL